MIRVQFACGHGVELPVNHVGAPVCPHCHETRIAAVFAPAPRFTGTVSGPCATTKELSPATVSLSATTLPLKRNDHDR